MSPALIERLLAVAREAEAAGHGKKQAVYQSAAQELGFSVPTLHRKLNEVTMKKPRKRREDSGKTALTLEEARYISAYLQDSNRANNKRLASVENAVEVLRSNGVIRAERIDETTGEVKPMSISAITRGLMKFGLHPEQQSRPSPKVRLASKYPNHVWQIDPSLCVLYYLPNKSGLRVMEKDAFYKNKPQNFKEIEKDRVWRYVITDHASGVIFVQYVLGAESATNLIEAFINATQKRHKHDPFHGLPEMLMMDKGSANTSKSFETLLRAVDVELYTNKPGQPWAKGQVEKSNDIVERDFEHRLRFLKTAPDTLESINEVAWAWMRAFNKTRIHSRTKRPRYDVWQTITEDQLRLAPPRQMMFDLVYGSVKTPKVSPQLTIRYNGNQYSVSHIDGIEVGMKVEVTRNPWRGDDSAQVMMVDAEGRTVAHVVEAMEFNEFGFTKEDVEIGSGFQAHKDTRLEQERKAVNRLSMEADTDEQAEKHRKQKRVPFGGKVDPMKPIRDTPMTDYIPKRGTEADVTPMVVQEKPLTHVEAAKLLSQKLGSQWEGAAHFKWLKQHYPEGVPREAMADIEQKLTAGAAPLRIVK